MNPKKQDADFLHVGRKLVSWYKIHGRDLPFRKTKDPYRIWICEIIFQQTRISQGIHHYNSFVERFPDVKSLAEADTDEVLLYWKGLGYYSRALNLHKASKQIINEFEGEFPKEHHEILTLKGVGKYTAAAVSSICFGRKIPAVDGNFYRVLSRIFADDFDVSSAGAFQYFSNLALRMMPENEPGIFNEAMMDLGSEICKPRNPDCSSCPLAENCTAYQTGQIQLFPVKKKKLKVENLALTYYFIEHDGKFLIRQRGEDFIWKKLFEFPDSLPENWEENIISSKLIQHKLTHRNLAITINNVRIPSEKEFQKFAEDEGFTVSDYEAAQRKSFPKPLRNYLDNWILNL